MLARFRSVRQEKRQAKIHRALPVSRPVPQESRITDVYKGQDQAWDWLRRIWIAWAVINGIGAFIAYVAPLFQGLATIQS